MKFDRNNMIKAVIAVVALAAISATTPAMAATYTLGGFASNWKSEYKLVFPVILLGISAIGICLAAWGTISAIMTKKQQQPLTWQHFAIFGGAAAVVIPVIILAFAGSMVGSNSATQQFDDLDIKY